MASALFSPITMRGAETAYAPKMMAAHPKMRPWIFPNHAAPPT